MDPSILDYENPLLSKINRETHMLIIVLFESFNLENT
jgi:hypothetical protein